MNEEETPTVPLATPAFCPRCKLGYGYNGLFCPLCQDELQSRLKRRVDWGIVTDWPPTESLAGQIHSNTMQDSANLVEAARKIRAHCPRTMQLAQIMSRAMRDDPAFWAMNGDIPL